ncbi:PH domain-containing protein [Cnuibacter sp. UC19_7]|uniref:PH domain-containing protein n=1 Tax=Cnuibacter sp. UC19_7 TaxID=3350166 RepID=UPI003670054F
MPKSAGDTDDLTSAFGDGAWDDRSAYGETVAHPRPQAGRQRIAANDQASTERFGWGAARPQQAARPPQQQSVLGASASPHPWPLAPLSSETAPVPERILARMRPHGRRLILPVLVLFAVSGAFGWFYGSFAEEWQNIAVLAGAVAAVVLLVLLPYLAWLGHRYTITTRRIIARRGLLVRHRQDVFLARVTDVRLRRGPLQAMVRSGDVRVVAGPDLTVVLQDVPSATLVSALLGDLTEHPTATWSLGAEG